MSLANEVYKELEDIVGPDNISQDKAVTEAYTAFGFGSTGPEPQDRYFNSPEAVVLPGSTEEVQAIMRVCNRRGIRAKASSTGYGPHNAVSGENTITLDMRRMNRILEIDVKNMVAVVEPYVCFAQLQGEAMKVGLISHVIGAGSNTSALASSTSMHGTNTQSVSLGYGGRNLLGVEWVLPTGEVLRLGAVGSRAGWYSGDGPGPSLRGVMRGHAGAQAGLGVFTKCAIHLRPWAGPPTMELDGVSPYYQTEIPPLFAYHMIAWPDWNKAANGMLKIGMADIAMSMHKSGGPGTTGTLLGGCNNDYYELHKQHPEFGQMPFASFAIVMMGHTQAQADYNEKTLKKILEDTEGYQMPIGEMDMWKKVDYINMIRGCFIPRLAFRTAGSFACPLQGSDTVDHCAAAISLDEEFRTKYDEQDLLFNDGNNGMWYVTDDGSHYALFECGHMYSPTEADSWKAGAQMMAEGSEICLKFPFSSGWTLMGNDVVKQLGPRFCNVQNWQIKIKQALDPNTAADPGGYVSVEDVADNAASTSPFAINKDIKIV